MSAEHVKVVYIAGSVRSGSTILGNILGQIDGFFHTGELNNVWDKLNNNNAHCGCGASLRQCIIWQRVLHNTFGGIEQIDIDEMLHHRAIATRTKQIPLMLMSFGKARLKSRSETYFSKLAKLYKSIQSETSSKVIIDSSKLPSYGYMIGTLPIIDLYVIHLIRDSRAVAYSCLRKKVEPDTGKYVTKLNAVQSSLRWSIQNIACEMLWKRDPKRYLLIRYEDFAKNPFNSIINILNFLREAPLTLPFTNDYLVTLKENHTVSGNPNRLLNGKVVLNVDDEWISNIRFTDFTSSTFLTWPLLTKYKYRIIT